ncbi:hypothetical protein LNP04_03405 [Chryseobacterium sp. C-71]|uniref:hypothetical protein n=1 Tax=Chryseobacterium sp. C-71 TaxID=2893882 RepID=UPI001E3E6A38|nr:hypothetical protein [Chryseobacterium sp. C-71]UFH32779.1 hypothetical protein LNP04_03405 [Chryseobacterium sp. C-71]
MNYLEKKGQRRTHSVFAAVLLVSLYTIYFNQSSRPEIDIQKLISQIIRFFLTVGLLYLVYIGKNWARILSIFLFSLAIILALSVIFSSDFSLLQEVPFYVMIFVYSDAIYHFGFSENFKAFIEFQKRMKK